MTRPRCPYCDRPAALVPTEFGLKWECRRCDARVGCHPGGSRPLGTLANAALRAARVEAHRWFDPLWQSGELRRPEAYALLGSVLGVPKARQHIGELSLEECQRLVKFLRARHERAGSLT